MRFVYLVCFFLRLEELILFKDFNLYSAAVSIFIAIPIFWVFGLYRTIFRYTSLSIVVNILASTFIYSILYFLVVGIYGIQGFQDQLVLFNQYCCLYL